jgi:hypothetical protein
LTFCQLPFVSLTFCQLAVSSTLTFHQFAILPTRLFVNLAFTQLLFCQLAISSIATKLFFRGKVGKKKVERELALLGEGVGARLRLSNISVFCQNGKLTS